MKKWCEENDIHLINADNVFSSDDIAYLAYKNELHKGNYGSTTDIARWFLILKYLNGVWSDMDTRNIKSLSDIWSDKNF